MSIDERPHRSEEESSDHADVLGFVLAVVGGLDGEDMLAGMPASFQASVVETRETLASLAACVDEVAPSAGLRDRLLRTLGRGPAMRARRDGRASMRGARMPREARRTSASARRLG